MQPPLTARVTGPANNESVRFLVFGDWGGLPFYPYTTRIQRNLAKTMAAIADVKRVDFVLSLGDNFYFKGVRSVDDRRFKVSPSQRLSRSESSIGGGRCHITAAPNVALKLYIVIQLECYL